LTFMSLGLGAQIAEEVPAAATSPNQTDVQVSAPAPALALVVPTLYEAPNIRAVLERARKSLDPLGIPYELIVVDDDSRDGIDATVEGMALADQRLRFLARAGQRGLSGAVIHGWQHSQAEVLGVIDADLQHPPELLPELWKAIEGGNDLALASRYIRSGDRRGRYPARHLLSHLAILLTWPLQRPRIRVSDPLSGFFLVRRHCLGDLGLRTSGFKILLEILVRADLGSVAEVPFIFWLRPAGTSKAGLQVGLDYLMLLATLCKQSRR
jgi:dolichol-phosphate mannosyltransferase